MHKIIVKNEIILNKCIDYILGTGKNNSDFTNYPNIWDFNNVNITNLLAYNIIM